MADKHVRTDGPHDSIHAALSAFLGQGKSPKAHPAAAEHAVSDEDHDHQLPASGARVDVATAILGVDAGESNDGTFVPRPPQSFREAGVNANQVEALVLKFLLHFGASTGREIASQIALPFGIVEPLLHQLKAARLVIYKSAAPVGDYVYENTEAGTDRARRFANECTYSGSTPVPLDDYLRSVAAQSVRNQHPTLDDLRHAMDDLVLDEEMLGRIGEAINAGMGLFLYGAPGNGKTSIAERVTQAYGESVWIPRAISAGGEVIRLFDTSHHEPLPPDADDAASNEQKIDERWIRIRRPTIVAGGELTMDQLEVTVNPITQVAEAPLHMKSNCGTLVIDDFGRQRVSPGELLNRWIVPLEKRFDNLGLPSGRSFQVAFDQLIIFSTNLEPRDLVDEAFLRRIPYKVDVHDPTEHQFRALFARCAQQMAVSYDAADLDYLVDTHYRQTGRPMRFCHPIDILRQVHNACDFRGMPSAVTRDRIDAAAKNYFSNTLHA